MKSDGGSPKRRGAEQGFDALVAWATRISRRQAWATTALAVALAAFADRVTGSDIWFGPLYLLIICLPAWALGPRAGVLTGLACAGASIAANGMSIYPLGHVAIAWNMALRLLCVAFIVVLVGGFRRSYDREWQRARSDALTGALSKQAFHERAAAAVVRHRKWGVLAYADLDGFKQINDRHGHAAGDELLRAFAAGVRNNIRSTDIFARIGGDEFLLFLVVDDEAEGYHIAGQLHARMNDVLSLMTHPISCSMGALVLTPEAANVADTDIELADRLMYEAKRDGRAALRIATKGRFFDHEQHATRTPAPAGKADGHGPDSTKVDSRPARVRHTA